MTSPQTSASRTSDITSCGFIKTYVNFIKIISFVPVSLTRNINVETNADYSFDGVFGAIVEKRVRGLTLDEFLSMGRQRDPNAFRSVKHSAGFNIEMMFDDNLVAYKKDELAHALTVDLEAVNYLPCTMDEIVDWGKVNKDRWIEIGQ
ncbi:hypothetical protein LguiA_029963 [Lonicera macranthoides]